MTVYNVDVAIVGAGIVGQTLALGLAEQDFNVALIDAQAIPKCAQQAGTSTSENTKLPVSSFSPRVSALSLASERILKRLHVWPEIQRLQPYQHMHVWEDQAFGRIQFSAQEQHLAHLGHIVENDTICAALHKRAKSFANIQYFTPCKLESMEALNTSLGFTAQNHASHHASAHTSNQALNSEHKPQLNTHNSQQDKTNQHMLSLDNGVHILANLVVGADGGQSLVRKQAGFPTAFWDYDQIAIVANLRTECAHDDVARQAFSEHGPLAFLPLPDKHQCSIVWSQNIDEARRLLALNDAAFCQAVQVAIDNQLGKCELATARFHYPLKMQYAKQWVDEGIALVGDAAHTIHPLAGQGANLGLLDAAALVQVLSAAKNAGKDFSSKKQLRAYERWRKTEAIKMIASMEGFKQLFDGANPLKKLIRNTGLLGADSLSPLKKAFAEQALGSNGKLPELAKHPVTPLAKGTS